MALETEKAMLSPCPEEESLEIHRLPPPVDELPKAGRRKLWDIPHKYHCPVIGTCLSVEELRRVASRFLLRGDAPSTDYEIHVTFVGAAESKNLLSLATHKTLERKYRSVVERFAKAREPDALRALWAEFLARGEVPAALWALMTHPKADHGVLNRAYEEVHMLSHQLGAGQRADLKRLAETRSELETLKRDFDALHNRLRRQAEDREGQIQELERTLTERNGELARVVERERELKGRLAALEGGLPARRIAELEVGLAALKIELVARQREIESRQEVLDQAQQRIEEQASALREARAENQALERLVSERLAEAAAEHCEDCPNLECARRADLAGRLVLCVGGRLTHVRELSRLVARCNGRFDHHDGGLEDRDRRLESLLAGADAVICATDFVSHSAYYRTKQFCKRHDKPHVLLPRSGLSAFALALERVAG